MTAVDDLAAWLTQIWDEDEEIARAVQSSPSWHAGDDSDDWSQSVIVYMWPPEFHTPRWEDRRWRGEQVTSRQIAAHIARQDPAAVLARIAADRQMLALHHPDRHLENWFWLERECAECKHRWHKWLPDKPPTEIGPEQGCPTVRLLALPHADRPGYQEAWRPA